MSGRYSAGYILLVPVCFGADLHGNATLGLGSGPCQAEPAALVLVKDLIQEVGKRSLSRT
jgi:hypothetical protein